MIESVEEHFFGFIWNPLDYLGPQGLIWNPMDLLGPLGLIWAAYCGLHPS